MASGMPWVMIGSALSAWLKDGELSRSSIGLFGVLFVAYSINFLWSPLLDRVRIPWLTTRMGQRRSWIVVTQWGVILSCLSMASLQLPEQLFAIALSGLLIAISSATQDIAIDAFRIDVIGADEKQKLSAGSAMATAGWWTGYGGLGAIPFFLADLPGWQWQDVYYVLAFVMLILHTTVYWISEPITDRDAVQASATEYYSQRFSQQTYKGFSAIAGWLAVTLIEPFKDFFTRNGVKLALSMLLFIFLFKVGEAFLGRMSIVFYKEIGFTNTEIGTLSKLLNWWVTIIFAVIGGMVNMRYGIYRGLMIAGIAMASSNLMFSVIAEIGPSKPWFIATIIVDGFTAAWSTVAMVAFISLLCNKTFSATQYALMASLSNLSRTLLSSTSGFIVDALDGNWSLFFILTAIMVTPSLLFLYSLRHKITALEQSRG
nr:MFS transporter [Alteromonas facilis]